MLCYFWELWCSIVQSQVVIVMSNCAVYVLEFIYLLYCFILQKEEQLDEETYLTENNDSLSDSNKTTWENITLKQESGISAGWDVTKVKSSESRKVCNICGKSVVASYLNKHIKTIHSGKYFHCAHCEYKTESKNSLTEHISALHVGQKYNEAFSKLIQHTESQSKSGKTYWCTICYKNFARKENWLVHLQVKHGSDSRCESCTICGKIFSCRKYLRDHMSRNHPKPESLFVCHCGRSFAYESYYKEHILTHSDVKNFKCPECDKSFKTKSNLNGHIKSVHCDYRPFQCNVCLKAFKMKYDLTKHSIVHSNAEPFVCKVCNKLFSRKYQLKSHTCNKATEESNEDLSCHCHCGQSFRTQFELNSHSLVHTEVRDFKCTQCDKSFKKKDKLKKHMLTVHSDARPYQCNICGMCFKLKYHCQRHLVVHSTPPVHMSAPDVSVSTVTNDMPNVSLSFV